MTIPLINGSHGKEDKKSAGPLSGFVYLTI